MKRLMIIMMIILVIIVGCKPVATPKNKTTLRIMAAASLTEVFNELQQKFEKKYPKIEIEVNYAGSQALANQIKLGAQADIFASANMNYMKELKTEGLIMEPSVFARNKLVIGVFHEKEEIKDLADLLGAEIKLVIANKSVPVGRYTMEMLEKLNSNEKLPDNYKQQFLNSVVSKELDVKSVIRKVELGVVDAGVIYQTDITPQNSSKIKTMNISEQYNVVATYPVAILKKTGHKQASKKFLKFLYSQEGGKTLEKYGFVKESR